MSKFYITCAIPYVNAKPHVGHALEFVQGDVISRFHKIIGDDVLFLSGGDENALKNVQAAEKAGETVQAFVDKNTTLFSEMAEKLHVHFDVFQKGSDKKHYQSSQKLWELCKKSGDIYKKAYTGLYCVGCELFYEKGELDENGECFEHPGKALEEVTEENYFFRLSRYQEQITRLIETDQLSITPVSRKNEMLAFLKNGLEDISISRSNKRAKNWGVPVPGDNEQIMYVWFDALNIYQSGVGFGVDEEAYKKWWPADLHVIGKGITRFHAIYWPAFLLSAKLKLPKALFVHGYFTVNGQKMSKSLGNVIDPLDVVKEFGVDAFRYYLLREIPSTADGDFSITRLKEVYNADLANGLGNTVSRLAKLCERSGFNFLTKKNADSVYRKAQKEVIEDYRFDLALQNMWTVDLHTIDIHINQHAPWQISETTKLQEVLQEEINMLRELAAKLRPFLPETAEKIQEQFKGPKIISQKPLFPRL